MKLPLATGGPVASARKQLAHDITWLYLIHALNYLLPLLLIPVLARVLGASGWGSLAFALAFSNFVYLATDYGFYLSAQRDAARHQHDRPALVTLFGQVHCAKLMMSGVVLAVAAALSAFIPMFKADYRLFAGALFLGITQAFTLTWYFRGVGRIRVAAVLEALGKAAGAALVVIFVASRDDAWKYFFAFGAPQLAITALAFVYVARDLKFRTSNFSHAFAALRDGAAFFRLHAIGSIFSGSNVFVIGLLAPPNVVGYFAGAEKIARLAAFSLEPVRQALFPRFSALVHHDSRMARRQLKRALWAMIGVSSLLACLLFGLAPIVVRSLLGEDLQAAASTLRALAVLPPIIAVTGGLSYVWIVPRHREHLCVPVLLGAVAVNLLLAFWLVPLIEDTGMAIAAIAAECIVAIGYAVIFLKDPVGRLPGAETQNRV